MIVSKIILRSLYALLEAHFARVAAADAPLDDLSSPNP
jgi:hypothetical protein